MHRERHMFSGTLLVLLLVVVIPGDTPHNNHSPFHLPVPMVCTWLSVQSIFEFIMLALLAAIYYVPLLTSKRWEMYSYAWINRLFLFQWSYRSSERWHIGSGRSAAPWRLQPEHTAYGKLGLSTSLYPCVSFLWFEVTFIPQRTDTWPFQYFLQYAFLFMAGKPHSVRNSTFINKYYSSNFKLISHKVELCFIWNKT